MSVRLGAIQFTLIFGANSAANARVNPSTAPFAPAILEEYCSKYFKINQASEHMLIACDVKPRMKKFISATVHVDNTCRVQTVTSNSNKKFYDLLKVMHDKTNVPVLLNTSFNIKGQPIVDSPNDALLCFIKHNIDYLFIGDYILKEEGKSKFVGVTHSVVKKGEKYIDITPTTHSECNNVFIPTNDSELSISRFEYYDNHLSYEYY